MHAPKEKPTQTFTDPSTWDAASGSSIVIKDAFTLALALRRARGHAGLSQRGLATKAGIAPSTLTRLESVIGDPSIRTVLALFEAAGVQVEVTGLAPTTFPFAVIEEQRDKGRRHAPPHRLSEEGYGYWDRTTAGAKQRAAEDARGLNMLLSYLATTRNAQRRDERRADEQAARAQAAAANPQPAQQPPAGDDPHRDRDS